MNRFIQVAAAGMLFATQGLGPARPEVAESLKALKNRGDLQQYCWKLSRMDKTSGPRA